MSVAKTIRRVTDSREQQQETDRYWQSQSVGDRLSAVWVASEAAYAFAAAFKGAPLHDDRRSERTLTRVQRSCSSKLASGREQDMLDVKKLQAAAPTQAASAEEKQRQNDKD
jgi:hypothetical protein